MNRRPPRSRTVWLVLDHDGFVCPYVDYWYQRRKDAMDAARDADADFCPSGEVHTVARFEKEEK